MLGVEEAKACSAEIRGPSANLFIWPRLNAFISLPIGHDLAKLRISSAADQLQGAAPSQRLHRDDCSCITALSTLDPRLSSEFTLCPTGHKYDFYAD